MTVQQGIETGLAVLGGLSVVATGVSKALSQLARVYPWASRAAAIAATVGYDIDLLRGLLGGAQTQVVADSSRSLLAQRLRVTQTNETPSKEVN